MHRFSKKHCAALARAIAGVVMPNDSRKELARRVVEILDETAPKGREGKPPKYPFTPGDRVRFLDGAAPDSGVEIVVTVVQDDHGRVEYEGWSVWSFHPDWGLSTREAGSFAEALELAWREEFRKNPKSIPVRIEKL